MKSKIVRRLNRLNLHKFKRFKSFINKTILATFIILLVLSLKKINLGPTNKLLRLVEKGISSEFKPVEETKNIFSKANKLLTRSTEALRVFNPIKMEKYEPPIIGTLSRAYEKNENEGVDIKSQSGEDPKAITGGQVKDVKLVDNKGFFVTIEKENLEISYGYLSKPYVSIGEEVEAGDFLGSLGTNKDGNKYLRIEMKVDGNTVNPSKYIELE